MVSPTAIVIHITLQMLSIRIYKDHIFCLQVAFISVRAKFIITRFYFSNQRTDFPLSVFLRNYR